MSFIFSSSSLQFQIQIGHKMSKQYSYVHCIKVMRRNQKNVFLKKKITPNLIYSGKTKSFQSSCFKRMPFLCKKQDFKPMQKKKRERSVKHRLHDAGGKTDGKSTLFWEISGKSMISKIPVFPLQNGKFNFFCRNFGKLQRRPQSSHGLLVLLLIFRRFQIESFSL